MGTTPRGAYFKTVASLFFNFFEEAIFTRHGFCDFPQRTLGGNSVVAYSFYPFRIPASPLALFPALFFPYSFLLLLVTSLPLLIPSFLPFALLCKASLFPLFSQFLFLKKCLASDTGGGYFFKTAILKKRFFTFFG